MELTTDQIVYWQSGIIKLNATIVHTWVVMAILVVTCWLVTRRLSTSKEVSRWQSGLETTVEFIKSQIEDIIGGNAGRYMPFIGTLLLFISLSNFLAFVPGYHPPTGSLSTTVALAGSVFLAVPSYGIYSQGVIGYLRHYVRPTPVMLPFHVVSEISRSVAMTIRLFGNVMSGTLIGAILLTVIPFIFPVFMHLLELIIGQVQAYIFSVLATVYIGSASRAHQKQRQISEADNSANGKET